MSRLVIAEREGAQPVRRQRTEVHSESGTNRIIGSKLHIVHAVVAQLVLVVRLVVDLGGACDVQECSLQRPWRHSGHLSPLHLDLQRRQLCAASEAPTRVAACRSLSGCVRI